MQQLWRRIVSALTIGLCLIAQPLIVATAPAQQQKPNILFILADNIGYGDIGVYGGGELRGAPTPRIGAEGRGGIQGEPREASEPAGSEHDEVLSGNSEASFHAGAK